MNSKNIVIFLISILSIFVVIGVLFFDVADSNISQKVLKVTQSKRDKTSSSVEIEHLSSNSSKNIKKNRLIKVKKDGFLVSINHALPVSEDRPITIKIHTSNQIISLSLPQFDIDPRLSQITLKIPSGESITLTGENSFFLADKDSIVDIYAQSGKIESIRIGKKVSKIVEDSSSLESNLPHFNY
jgi:hypothetical protein